MLSRNLIDASAQVDHALEGLRWFSVAILSLFCLEIAFVVLVEGPRRYFRSVLSVLDLIVVTCSLVFEVVLTGFAETVTGLLIVLRLWRILHLMDEARLKDILRQSASISYMRFARC